MQASTCSTQIERSKTVDEVLELISDALIAAALADQREMPRATGSTGTRGWETTRPSCLPTRSRR